MSVRERAEHLITLADDIRSEASVASRAGQYDRLTAIAERVEAAGREALNRIEAASKLHSPTRTDSSACGDCLRLWPCPTWLALNPKEADGG